MSGSFVWIMRTAEPDSEVAAVFASREALDYEYPGMQPNHDDLILERPFTETLYATEYPLLAYYPEPLVSGQGAPGATPSDTRNEQA